MSILFVNGSPNKVGNTAILAEQLLRGKEYQTLNLTNYKIYSYGQEYPDDQFMEVISEIEKNDIVVFGSPVYWHNICGALRNVLDRTYGVLDPGAFAGKKMFFIFQGAAPEQWMLDAGEYTMKRFACAHTCPQKSIDLTIPEVNPDARYRNEHISLQDIIEANYQRKGEIIQ